MQRSPRGMATPLICSSVPTAHSVIETLWLLCRWSFAKSPKNRDEKHLNVLVGKMKSTMTYMRLPCIIFLPPVGRTLISKNSEVSPWFFAPRTGPDPYISSNAELQYS
jgi:hypothetical protein